MQISHLYHQKHESCNTGKLHKTDTYMGLIFWYWAFVKLLRAVSFCIFFYFLFICLIIRYLGDLQCFAVFLMCPVRSLCFSLRTAASLDSHITIAVYVNFFPIKESLSCFIHLIHQPFNAIAILQNSSLAVNSYQFTSQFRPGDNTAVSFSLTDLHINCLIFTSPWKSISRGLAPLAGWLWVGPLGQVSIFIILLKFFTRSILLDLLY